MKRLGVCLMFVILMLCIVWIFPHSAAAESGTVTGTCGENLSWVYDSATATLTVSGHGAMDDYANAYADAYDPEVKAKLNVFPWYNEEETWLKMQKVVVEEGVTTIGDHAFWRCPSLKEVHLPSGMESIGKKAFAYSKSLGNISFEEGPRVIRDGAFSGSPLRELIIPEGTEILEGEFIGRNDCITTIVLPNSIVKTDQFVIMSCPALKNVTLPNNLDLSNIVSLIADCPSIEYLEIPKGTKYIAGIIKCASLKTVKLPEGLLECCGFSQCPALTEMEFPESVTRIEIGAPLKSIGIPRNVQSFYVNTENLETVALSSENPYFRMERQCLIENESGTLIWGRYATEIPEGIAAIKDGALYGVTALTELAIPESMSKISQELLKGCTSLSRIYIHQDVTYIATGFTKDCKALSEIVIAEENEYFKAEGRSVYLKKAYMSGGDTLPAGTLISHPAEDPIPSSVRVIRGVYGDGTAYEIPEGIETVWTVAFQMPNLTELIVPTSVTTFHRSFYSGATNIEAIYYAGSKAEWNEINFVIFEGAPIDPSIPFWNGLRKNIYYMNGVARDEFSSETTSADTTDGDITTEIESTATDSGFGCSSIVPTPAVLLFLGMLIPVMLTCKKHRDSV